MGWLTYITTFTLIILCELGDKTQVAVLLLASNQPKNRWLIFFTSAAALSLCVLVEVTVGKYLAQYLSPQVINKLTGFLFLFIGCSTLLSSLVQSKKGKEFNSKSENLPT
jgi:putative Ca2+/H+ antiporter (TMEM165/GDT1 family)